MLIDHKWLQAAVVVVALTTIQAYATEVEDDNFYLAQMRSLSKTSSPDQAAAPSGTELVAGNDIKTLAKQDSLSELGDVKPEFKPSLSDIKPKL